MSGGSGGGGGGGDIFAAVAIGVVYAIAIVVALAMIEIARIHAVLWPLAKEKVIVTDIVCAGGFLMAVGLSQQVQLQPYAWYVAAISFSGYAVTMLALDLKLGVIEAATEAELGDLDAYLEFSG